MSSTERQPPSDFDTSGSRQEATTGQSASLSWDQYFILIALFTSLRSKDPRSKVGAVIVDPQNHIIGTGYNGFVGGADETAFSWGHDHSDWLNSKYPYVVHAEQNAILNATTNDLRGSKIYTTLFPCNECARVIAQKRIREVVYLSDKHKGTPAREAASRIFRAASLSVRQIPVPEYEGLARSVISQIMTY